MHYFLNNFEKFNVAANQKKETKQVNTAEAEAPHVGVILKKARENRKLSLQQVSKELMIRRFYLEAVEDGKFQELPAKVFSTGFVRTYAKLLGLNADHAVARFIKDAYGEAATEQPELAFPEPVDTSILPNSTLITFGGLGAALIVVLLIGLSFSNQSEQPEQQVVIDLTRQNSENQDIALLDSETTDSTASSDAEGKVNEETETSDLSVNLGETSQDDIYTQEGQTPVETTETTEASTSDTTDSETEATTQAETPTAESQPVTQAPAPTQQAIKSRISIFATEASWVEIKTPDDKIILSRVLKEGQEYKVPDRPNLTMMTGNAGGIYLVVDGQKLPSMGIRGDVKRNVRLTPSVLLTNTYR